LEGEGGGEGKMAKVQVKFPCSPYIFIKVKIRKDKKRIGGNFSVFYFLYQRLAIMTRDLNLLGPAT
jgi:hypothetical protein